MAGPLSGVHAGAAALHGTIVDRLEAARTLIDLADALGATGQDA